MRSVVYEAALAADALVQRGEKAVDRLGERAHSSRCGLQLERREGVGLAVLDKRAGLNLATDDVFVNVAGGMTLDEPAADLAVIAAVASSLRNRPIPPDVVVFGEIGLAGEVRATSQAALRVREASQIGFRRCLLPDRSLAPGDVPEGLEIVGVRSVGEALDALM